MTNGLCDRAAQGRVSRCVLLCPYREQAGGAELSLLHLLEHGRGGQDGVEWSLACLEDGEILETARGWGIPGVALGVRKLGSADLVPGLWRLVRFCRSQQADVVLGWMPQVGYLACLAALMTGAHASWFQKGGAKEELTWWRRWILTARVRALLANSVPTGLDQFRQTRDRPVVVVPSGVDLSRFDGGRLGTPAACRAALGLPTTGRVLVMVGRLQRWKGFHTLIEAMPELLSEDASTTAVLVGGAFASEPGYEEDLRALSASLGVSERVVFAGAVEHADVPRYMQAADVVVHASHHEPFGIVIVEAMALGKPLVASRVGGPGATVTDGRDGLLIDPERPDELAGAVLRYWNDPGLVERVAACGPGRAADFSVGVFADRMAGAIRGMVDGPALKPGVYLDNACLTSPGDAEVTTGARREVVA
ncbi:MAG: glycosyltransferase family 4 protein [Planctomycetota bacterium]